MRKIQNYTTEIKLVRKQITYFYSVIQSEITTTEELSETEKKTGQHKNYRLASEVQYFLLMDDIVLRHS